MGKARIYMDWNATAPLLAEARAACVSALDLPGNASSVHGEGRVMRGLIEAARRDVATLCGASASSVIFTSGATEAANLILTPDFRMGKARLMVGHLYVSAIEHPAVREGGRFGPEQITEIPVMADGAIDLGALEQVLAGHDRALGLPMVAVMLANNETGILQPIDAVAKIVKAAAGLLVVDAVQAVGRIPVSIEDLGADFLIVSSHKIGGPKGAGALIARGEILMPAPLLRGGGQEKGHRSGTENPVAIAGFAAAARVAVAQMDVASQTIMAARDRLEDAMLAAAPDLVIHGRGHRRLPNTSFFTLPGLKAETGQIAFDLEGVAVSAGSACSSGKVGQSYVLAAMGQDARHGALRISIGATTTDEEIAICAAAFARIASRRRLTETAA